MEQNKFKSGNLRIFLMQNLGTGTVKSLCIKFYICFTSELADQEEEGTGAVWKSTFDNDFTQVEEIAR